MLPGDVRNASVEADAWAGNSASSWSNDRDGGAEIVLTHRGLPPSALKDHQNGWGDIVRELADALAITAGRDGRQ